MSLFNVSFGKFENFPLKKRNIVRKHNRTNKKHRHTVRRLFRNIENKKEKKTTFSERRI